MNFHAVFPSVCLFLYWKIDNRCKLWDDSCAQLMKIYYRSNTYIYIYMLYVLNVHIYTYNGCQSMVLIWDFLANKAFLENINRRNRNKNKQEKRWGKGKSCIFSWYSSNGSLIRRRILFLNFMKSVEIISDDFRSIF